MIDYIPLPAFVIRKDTGRIVECNARAVELSRTKARKLRGKDIREYVPRFDDLLDMAKKGQMNEFDHISFKNRKGEESNSCITLQYLEEEPGKLIVTCREMSSVQEKNKLFRKILDALPIAIFAKNHHLQHTYVNQEFMKKMKLTLKEALGKFNHELYPREQANRLNDIEKGILASGETREGMIELLQAADDKFYGYIEELPLFNDDGEVEGITGSALDITGSGRERDSRQGQKNILSLITETAPIMLYVVDMKTNSNIYSNAGVKNLLGYTQQEIRGMGGEILTQLVHPEDLSSLMVHQEEVKKASDDTILEITYRMKHRNGGWLTFHGFERPFQRDVYGTVTQKIGVATDISNLVGAMEEYEKRADYMKKINELAVQLNTLKSTDDHYAVIAQALKNLTQAKAVTLSTYNPEQKALTVKGAAADSEFLERLNRLFGQNIMGYETPLTDDNYNRILNNVIKRSPDLYDTTFGMVPKSLSALIQNVFDIDHYIGMALTIGERLVGTAVIVIPSGQNTPSDEVLGIFARLVAPHCNKMN
ncbi:MAG: PAS domain S-box protein [Bacteroidales bacterium]|nr:PAS domain S-box protein [Bacteroidales bacterium]